MPLAVGLVPEDERGAVYWTHWSRTFARISNHVTAGDIGYHYVVDALLDGGRSDVLLDMLERTDTPSYGYQLAQGATALTEAWDANPTSSQDHFMLGHAEEWFYRGLGGINVDLSADAPRQSSSLPASLRVLKAKSPGCVAGIFRRWGQLKARGRGVHRKPATRWRFPQTRRRR